MSTGEETHGTHPSELKETIRESAADPQGIHAVADTPVETKAGGGLGSGGLASYLEFTAALIEIGLLDAALLERFAADSSEAVLGLSRALVKAGKLSPATSYLTTGGPSVCSTWASPGSSTPIILSASPPQDV
jgi:hypothetical protein